jgi:thioredoxin-related protein
MLKQILYLLLVAASVLSDGTSRADERPLLMVFVDPQCVECQRMQADMLADPALNKFLAGTVTEFVIGVNHPLVKKHGVEIFPMVILFDAKRKASGCISGYADAEGFVWMAETLLGK